MAKYSDLIKKQYNYNRDLDKEFDFSYTEAGGCPRHSPEECITFEGYITPIDQYTYTDKDLKEQKCKYLYHQYGTTYNSNKYMTFNIMFVSLYKNLIGFIF